MEQARVVVTQDGVTKELTVSTDAFKGLGQGLNMDVDPRMIERLKPSGDSG